jgi:cytochrome c553
MIRSLMRTLGRALDALLWSVMLASSARARPIERAAIRREAARRTWRKRLFEAAILFAVLGLLGALVAISGIMPIKASSGHWPITAWFLNFSMARSISTHTIGMKTPPLDDPAMVLKGAGHYQTACAACHGTPGLQRPRIARAMTPHPPYLPPMIGEWEPRELFYIVRHGVKFTGMPGWPTEGREDEVWAMVAFLLKLPALSADEYDRLVFGDAPETGEPALLPELLGPQAIPASVTESCARCHGIDGRGRGTGAFPKLAGQNPAYIYFSLRAFADGERHSGVMEPLAAGLSDQEMRELARYFAGLPPGPPSVRAADARAEATIARGEEIAHRGIPAHKVPACHDCHHLERAVTERPYPRLGGQYADYLVLQLELFKAGKRGGSRWQRLMHPVVERLESEDMRAVATYFASVEARGSDGGGEAPASALAGPAATASLDSEP